MVSDYEHLENPASFIILQPLGLIVGVIRSSTAVQASEMQAGNW